MAVTQRARTVVNSARKNAGKKRKLSPAQIKAGFGGKRRQLAAKTKRHYSAAARHNAPKRKASSGHRPRRAAKVARQVNVGKVVSFSLPKEFSQVATTTKRNTSHRKPSSHYRAAKRSTKRNAGHRRRTNRNPSMDDIAGLATTAVFTIAGAVGTQQLTQMVLTTSNTGVTGYFGNLVAAFLLSWGVKAFMKNDKAASAVLSGGFVEIVLRLIADYTPFGQYTSSLGMGDYLAQNFLTPQRLTAGVRNWTHSAAIDAGSQLATIPTGVGAGMGCAGGGSLYGGNLY